MTTLYQECLDALGSNIFIFNLEHSTQKAEKIFKSFKLTSWGRVDWSTKQTLFQSNNFNDFLSELHKRNFLNDKCLLLWGDMSLPVLATDVASIVNNRDDVTAVSFDTYVFIENKSVLIEFWHDGMITIGIAKE